MTMLRIWLVFREKAMLLEASISTIRVAILLEPRPRVTRKGSETKIVGGCVVRTGGRPSDLPRECRA